MARQFGPMIEIAENISIPALATDYVVDYTALDTVIDGPVLIVGMATQQATGTGELFIDMELPGGGERPKMCFPILTPAADVVPRYLPTEWTNDISELGAWRFACPIGWKFRESLKFHFANIDVADAQVLTVYLYVVPCTDADVDAVRAMGLHPAIATARYALAANGAISDDGLGAIEMSRDRGFLPLHQYVVSTGTFTHRWRLEAIEKQQAAAAAAKADGGYRRTAWWSRRPLVRAYWTNTGINRARTPRQWAPRGSKLYLESFDTSGGGNTVTHYLIGLASEDARDTPATIAQKLQKLRTLAGEHELARV